MYRWEFGDGSPEESGLEAQNVYTLPGSYQATLTVWDAFGSSAEARGTVAVSAPVPVLRRATWHSRSRAAAAAAPGPERGCRSGSWV